MDEWTVFRLTRALDQLALKNEKLKFSFSIMDNISVLSFLATGFDRMNIL